MVTRLKLRRIEKGIQQKDFAQMLGVTPQYVWLLETGKTEPRRDLMIRISEVLDISVNDLFFNY